jgi:hypothetical protein
MNKQLKHIKTLMKEEVKSKKYDNYSTDKQSRLEDMVSMRKAVRKQVREGRGHYDKHGNPIY